MCLLVLEVENRKEKENRNPIGNPNPTQQLKPVRPTLSRGPVRPAPFSLNRGLLRSVQLGPKPHTSSPTRARSARPFSPRRARLALTPRPTRRAPSSGSPSTSRNSRARRPQISARLPSRRTLPRSPPGLYLASRDSPLHLIPPRRHPKTLAAAHLAPPRRRTPAPPWTGRPATPGPRPSSAAAPPRRPVSLRSNIPRL